MLSTFHNLNPLKQERGVISTASESSNLFLFHGLEKGKDMENVLNYRNQWSRMKALSIEHKFLPFLCF